jgi:hypothetical protein
MGILNEARREFIAAPDSAKGQIVYKWPDHNIRKFARAIVEPDATGIPVPRPGTGRQPPGSEPVGATTRYRVPPGSGGSSRQLSPNSCHR